MGKLSVKNSDVMSKAILINDSQVIINASRFVFKDHSFLAREMILDALATNTDKEIIIWLFDGENIIESGMLAFIRRAMSDLGMKNLSFVNRDPKIQYDMFNTNTEMAIFANAFRQIKKYDDLSILPNARLVGCLIGRLSISRFRLAFELDRHFPNDNFTIFQPNKQFVADTMRQYGNHYEHMIKWLFDKKFDSDIFSDNVAGMIDHEKTYISYPELSRKYMIEVISETDSLGNHWFTEKTARCLAIGKPFVLISGKHSLRRLRAWGFVTMGDIIDESYDDLQNPTARIKGAINSLTIFDRSKYLDLLDIAKLNQQRYLTFCEANHSKPLNKYPYENH